MEIQNCAADDWDTIQSLYQAARDLQKTKNMVVWPDFESSLIEDEIRENRQWKLLLNGQVACVWATTFKDEDIWEEMDKGDGVYIHRIATHPDFRGKNLVREIVNWAKTYASQHDRAFVRLDTLGMNHKLIEHYTGAGFTFLGVFHLKNTQKLPLHYQKEPRCLLFELTV